MTHDQHLRVWHDDGGVITWCRPNPPVGALGDKWRPATSDVVVACVSEKGRYWDDLVTRKPGASFNRPTGGPNGGRKSRQHPEVNKWDDRLEHHPAGAPLLDYWEITAGGYKGSHYAVFPPALVEPLVKAMTPERVCRTCGEPSRRIVETSYEAHGDPEKQNLEPKAQADYALQQRQENAQGMTHGRATKISETIGWSDCEHDNWRSGLVLDPFAGSGTTLGVASGHGYDTIGIDLDERNEDLARDRIGPLMFQEAP